MPTSTPPSDPFGPYTAPDTTVCVVEVVVPPGWRVRVVEGAEFRVRLSPADAESNDDGDSNNVSPNQSRGGNP